MAEERIQALRVELKTWEKQFSVQHGGKRPSREDIKNNVEIAAKYREYDKLRRPTTKKTESQHIVPVKPSHATPKKAAPAATPQKPNSQFLIPNIVSLQEEEAELEPTPAAVRMHLGPTPQKDGQILSLFDDLSSTASKPSRTALASIEANANFTPSKPSQLLFAENESPPENVHDRTPASSSKRFLLDSFVSTTPLKRKREDEEPAHATPSSSKGLSTPAFLRRTSNMLIMDTLVEEAQDDHEIINMGRMRQPPFKKRGIVRSLSSIIQGLRKQEDDKLDEELEMMREMEDADDQDSAKPTVQVEDSQVVMPLGPDQATESEESEEEERDTGVFRKPWKKKGLKRQTKRVIMRPAPKSKAPAQADQPATTSDNEDNVAETQFPDELHHIDSDADSDAAYSDTEAKRKRQLTKTTTGDKDDTSKSSKGDGIVKKAAKKISATAHANFRRLNIKNKNSKANGRGRFGRK